jgi:hypothetical protein
MARGVDRRAVEINLPWTSNGAKAKLARRRRRHRPVGLSAFVVTMGRGLA